MRMPQALANIVAHSLTLYRINVNALDEDEYTERVNIVAQKLSTLHKLNPVFSMGEVFPSGPLGESIEILVEVPASESLKMIVRTPSNSYYQCLPQLAEMLERRKRSVSD